MNEASIDTIAFAIVDYWVMENGSMPDGLSLKLKEIIRELVPVEPSASEDREIYRLLNRKNLEIDKLRTMIARARKMLSELAL